APSAGHWPQSRHARPRPRPDRQRASPGHYLPGAQVSDLRPCGADVRGRRLGRGSPCGWAADVVCRSQRARLTRSAHVPYTFTMLVLIDNYDSFTYNLVHFLGELGAACDVHRNDKITVDEVL